MARIKLPTVQTVINADVANNLDILPRIVRTRGVLLIRMSRPIPPVVRAPSTPSPSPPPPSSADPLPPSTGTPPPVHPSDPVTSPSGATASPPLADSGVEPQAPVPLMSIDVVPPHGGSEVEFMDATDASTLEDPVSSQASLFSGSEDQIGEFSDETTPSPSPSPSPSISSFTSPSGACSESILKDAGIVSRGPTGAEQISNSNANNADNGKGDYSNASKSKSNDNGKGDYSNESNNNSKVKNGNDLKVVNSNSNGPKVADGNAKTSVSNSSGAPRTGPKSHPKVDAVSSDSDSEPVFKKPKVPVGIRSRSRSPLTSAGVHKSMPAVSDFRPSRSLSRTR